MSQIVQTDMPRILCIAHRLRGSHLSAVTAPRCQARGRDRDLPQSHDPPLDLVVACDMLHCPGALKRVIFQRLARAKSWPAGEP